MIPLHKVLMSDKVIPALTKTLESGYVAQGPKVEEFEAALEEILGAKVLTLNSCTSALDLALHLCSVDSKSEVISTPVTCTATNAPIALRSAKIVWADVDPVTGNIDPKDVARKITRRTAAIVVVDWAGRPCDYDALRAVSKGVPIIEDAAHAFGATYNGKPIAQSGGDYVCWSFQAIKHLNTGDGGAIKVPDSQYDRAKKLRWYGMDREPGAHFKQNIQESGFKYHMNDICATIGLANLKEAKEAVIKQRVIAYTYSQDLHLKKIKLPPYTIESSWWLYCILVDKQLNFMNFMEQKGITCSPVHGRNDRHEAFYSYYDLPGVKEFSNHEVAIPVGWWLSESNYNHIVDSIKEWDGI